MFDSSNPVIENAKLRAKEMDLVQIASDLGYTPVKVGTNQYRLREHDSLNIYMDRRSGNWKWKQFSTNDGGDCIAFVMKMKNNSECSFMEALSYLCPEIDSRNSYDTNKPIQRQAPKPKAPPPPPEPFYPPQEDSDTSKAYKYLTEERGLDGGMVSWLIANNYIAQDVKKGNVVFKIYDENNNYVGANRVGITGEKWKKIAAHSKSNYGFELKRGTGEYLVFCESEIDMLSCMQVTQSDERFKNARFVSMMGLKSNLVKATMERYHVPPEKVFISSDNDEPDANGALGKGHQFFYKLKEEFPQMRRVYPTNFKDWNDYLRYSQDFQNSRNNEQSIQNKNQNNKSKGDYER